jgi:hypothetical protein
MPPDSYLSGTRTSEGMGLPRGGRPFPVPDTLLQGLATDRVSMLHFEIDVLIHFLSVSCLHGCTCLYFLQESKSLQYSTVRIDILFTP